MEDNLITIKIEEEEYFTKTCRGCLSRDRKLTVLGENLDLFITLLGRNHELDSYSLFREPTHISLCWECSAVLRNTRRFQQRIRRAQDIMHQRLHLERHLYTSTCLSALTRVETRIYSNVRVYGTNRKQLSAVPTVQTENNCQENEVRHQFIEKLKDKGQLFKFENDADGVCQELEDKNVGTSYDEFQENEQKTQLLNVEGKRQEVKSQALEVERIEFVDCQHVNSQPVIKTNTEDNYENEFDSKIDIDYVRIEPVVEVKLEPPAVKTKLEIDCDSKENVNEMLSSDVGLPPVGKSTPEKIRDEENPLSCSFCDHKGFKKRLHLNRHLRTHAAEKPYICKICDKKFSNQTALKAHLRRHKGRPYSCATCHKSYTEFIDLKEHLRSHDSDQRFECDTCGSTYRQKRNLTKHLSVHNNKFQCTTCNKRFNSTHSLKAHIRVHTGEKPFVCETCHKTFASEANFRKHCKIHTNEKPYKCTICDKNYALKRYLINHLRHHNEDEQISCEVCGKKFANSTHYKIHFRVHTGEKPYGPCEICGKRFGCSTNLKTHRRIHTGEKPFKCETCDRRFRDLGTLRKHLKIHTEEHKLKISYRCQVCDRKFDHKHSLNAHEKTAHSDKDLPYVCTYCDMRFKRKDQYKIHVMLHTGEKPHTCNICHKSFATPIYLKKHLRTHMEDRPFICDVCDKRFKDKKTLRKHVLVMHSANRVDARQ